MRVLCVSNLYPPVVQGGYELGCADVMRTLAARGHDVRVLTSDKDADQAPPQPEVARVLPQFFDASSGARGLPYRVAAERRSRELFARAFRQHRPDVTYFFNVQGLARSLLFEAQDAGAPVAVYVSDPWFERWRFHDEWLRIWSAPDYAGPKGAVAKALRRVRVPGVRTRFGDLDLRGVHFTSAALRAAAVAHGQPVAGNPVVHWGVDPTRFVLTERGGPATRLLFVGRVVEPKGLHVALDALAIARERAPDLTLTVVGPEPDADYAARVRDRAAEVGGVTFAGPRPRDGVIEAYAAHDALVLPSVWPEPFSITLLEAMASGLAVVVANTGGSAELVSDGDNGLLYDATDAAACAAAIGRLQDAGTAARLARRARETVETTHSLDAMVDTVEALLADLTGAATRSA